uniref:SFRICE_014737 n=1 Tax=Spodoptera frugiperda TaxID=7108 RepID=A0A2H1VK08_SPOFR
MDPITQLPRFSNKPYIPNHQKAGNALVTPLVFQVTMGGGDCLPSGHPPARLPACSIKRKPAKSSEAPDV